MEKQIEGYVLEEKQVIRGGHTLLYKPAVHPCGGCCVSAGLMAPKEPQTMGGALKRLARAMTDVKWAPGRE